VAPLRNIAAKISCFLSARNLHIQTHHLGIESCIVKKKIMLGKFSKFAQNNSLSMSMNCKLTAGATFEGRRDKEIPRAPAKGI
jgi:hypothetical protein